VVADRTMITADRARPDRVTADLARVWCGWRAGQRACLRCGQPGGRRAGGCGGMAPAISWMPAESAGRAHS